MIMMCYIGPVRGDFYMKDKIKIQNTECVISEDLLNEIEHEFSVIDGLYACDNKNGKNLFKLNFSELLKKIDNEKHS